jgi:hypothetical protein
VIVDEEIRTPLNLAGIRPETIADFDRSELERLAESISSVRALTERDEGGITYSVYVIVCPEIPYDDQPEPPEAEIWSRYVPFARGDEYRRKVAVQDQEAIGALAFELAKFHEEDGDGTT